MTPFFSVVVAAHNVRAYLDDCVRSVLTQDFDDLELILVDAASDDGTGDMIRAYGDPRVRAVYLTGSAGPGRARNAGLDVVAGRYVLFLDSDDMFVPGALQQIHDRIVATDEPDIVLFDFSRTYWDGRRVRNPLHGIVARAAAGTAFTLADQPDVLMLFNAAWSKAYRADLLTRAGLRFEDGFYEDIPWTFLAWFAAGPIAALDASLVDYRQRVAGNILRTQSRSHMVVFDQWERVFAYMDAHPDTDRFRPVVFDYMVKQLSTVLQNPGRLPASARAEFFHRAAALYSKYRPDGQPLVRNPVRPVTAQHVRSLLLKGDRYGPFLAMQRATAAGERARTVQRKVGGRLAALKPDAVDPAQVAYRKARRQPVDPDLFLFSSYWDTAPACNPLAIARELAARPGSRRIVWVVGDTHRRHVPEGFDVVAPGTAAYGRLLATAGTLVNNVNYPTFVHTRSAQQYLQTQHGTPLKTMGLDMRERPLAKSGFSSWPAFLSRIAQWDYCLSSNRYSSVIWERAMPGRYRTLETGYPRNDVLVNGDPARAAAARERLGLGTRQALLYCPTVRDYGVVPGAWMDIPTVASALREDQVLLLRAHYLEPVPGLADLVRDGRVIDVSDYFPLEDLLLAADALITDYSSVMFDFANTGKPIINMAGDWQAYSIVRGTYFDITREHAGAFFTDSAALGAFLAEADLAALPTTDAYAAFRARFCEFDDGRAAARVVDLLLNRGD